MTQEKQVEEVLNCISKKSKKSYELWHLEDDTVSIFDENQAEVDFYNTLSMAKKDYIVF